MKNRFNKNENKIINNFFFKDNEKKVLSIFIIILFYIQKSLCVNQKNTNQLLLNLNQIKLSIKGPGTQSIINSGLTNKPNTIIYDNSEITFSNSQLNLNSNINIVTLKFSSTITNCNSMFKGCNQITEIDLTNFDSSSVQNIDYMFSGCSSLKVIKFGNFKTSKLNIMEYVFQDCEQLENIDLSSFDTSKVTDFHYMFSGCKQLRYLDLSNFRTPECICTYHMFSECTTLTSINFSGFDTSKVTLMHHMFYNCKSLVSLDLSSFDTSSLTNTENMFNGCTKLEYVNLIKAEISNSKIRTYGNMITNTASDIIFCVDETKTPLLNSLMNSNSQSFRISDCSKICTYRKRICCYYTCEDCESFGNDKYHKCIQCRTEYVLEIEFNGFKNCYIKCANLFYLDDNNILNCFESSNCPDEYSKLIVEKKQCIKNCVLDKEYIYEYKNKCYKECPNGTKESLEKNNICCAISINQNIFS